MHARSVINEAPKDRHGCGSVHPERSAVGTRYEHHRHLTFLITFFGKPFVADGFGNAMRGWHNAAGLPHCSANWLRKAGATIAADNGTTDRQLVSISGSKRAEQAIVDTEKAKRRMMAQSGMGKIDLRTDAERKMSHLDSGWDNSAKKVSKINGE